MSLVAGVMSGTSADGIDVALVEFARPPSWAWQLRGFRHRAYRPSQRQRILRAVDGEARVEELARLHADLGGWIGRAVLDACASGPGRVRPGRAVGRPLPLDLVASHGQTVFHAGRVATLQLGDAARIAALTGAAVVSDFRAADVAQGGEGAPLVPWADWHLFRHRRRYRAALNLGGIANLTLLPPGGARQALEQVMGFDTGPANMLCDALILHLSGGSLGYDRNGGLAAAGRINPVWLAELLDHPFYRRHPPKSCGREQFGWSYLDTMLRRLPPRQRPRSLAGRAAADAMATLVELSARTVVQGLGWGGEEALGAELIVAGGGTRNPILMGALRRAAPRVQWRRPEAFQVPAAAREAIAFAFLGEAHRRHLPANLPRVTGARRACVLGNLTPSVIQ